MTRYPGSRTAHLTAIHLLMPAKYIYAFLRGMRLNRTAHSWQRQAGQYRKSYIAVSCSAAGNLGIFFLRLHFDSLPPTSKKAVSPHMEVKSPAERLFKVKARTVYCWKTKIRSTFTEVSSPISSQSRHSVISVETSTH